jgi:thiol-disulfide isomerase/thioredoxin
VIAHPELRTLFYRAEIKTARRGEPVLRHEFVSGLSCLGPRAGTRTEKGMLNVLQLFTIPDSGISGADVAPDQSPDHREATGMHAIRSLTRCLSTAFAVFLLVSAVLLVRHHFTKANTPHNVGSLWSPPQIELASYHQAGGLSLKGGVAWINSGPISLAELRGKIVLLDFWTFCCVNCHHILPDLAKLEAKYKDELVVIGVHSAKFEAERDTENIRRKVAEYRIKHPVVNDANMAIWKRFEVNSWPTLILIDANGHYAGRASGEGNYETVDRAIGELVEQHKAKGELNLTPLSFTPEMERPTNGPLLYPGKVVADEAGKHLFIADTGHNRIIQTDLDGANPVSIGSGEEGFDDGDFKKASFNRPQGMFLSEDTLFVADTENHAIRAIDLKAGNHASLPRGVFRAGQDNSSLQPLGCHPDSGRQGTLYRHGRPAPDLEGRYRRRRGERFCGIGPRRHRRRTGRHSKFRTAQRAGNRR